MALKRVIDWKGAFVIGLGGTILVTGVTGPVLGEVGSAGILNFVLVAFSGVLLCLFLAELATTFPHRTGGAPGYAYVAFKERWPRLAPHINGITGWAYWLGWNPVIAVNGLLIGSYVDALLRPTGIQLPPILIGATVSFLLFLPAYLGIRPGAVAGVFLAIFSIVPLLVIALLPFAFPAHIHWEYLFPISNLGKPLFGFEGLNKALKLAFLTTWNALAMEAAACYLAECENPHRDAVLAMTAEGWLGMVVYTLVPLSFLIVLGAKNIAQDPYTMFATFVGPFLGAAAGSVVTIMLITALALSMLTAIMGCARSLYQMSLDGQFPRIFAHENRHSVPDFSMGLNVLVSIFIMFLGAPAYIEVFSNVGYLASFVPVLIGYYILRQYRPELPRPYRLPEPMKYVALLMAALYTIIWLFGGPMWGFFYYGMGWLVLLCYIPLYAWRRFRDRRGGTLAPAAAVSGR